MVRLLKWLRPINVRILFLVMIPTTPFGCDRVGGYPEETIATPLGREGVCVACGKTINSVNTTNLITFDGNQFIICGAACAKKAEGVIEHSHSH